MSDDSVLRRLAARARAEQEQDPPPLRAAIEAEPARRPGDGPVRTGDAALDELLAPLSGKVRQSLIDGAVRALGEEPRPLDVLPLAPGRLATGGRRATVRHRATAGHRKTAWIAAIAAPLALAAAVLLWVNRAPPLPAYALELSGTVDTVRGETPAAPQDAPVVEPGAPLTVVLRPARNPGADVVARAFWVKGGCVRAWPAASEQADGGGIRLTGRGEAPCGAGEGALVVVVGRRAAAGPEGGPGMQRVARAVRWR
jgi:hypothetical protein